MGEWTSTDLSALIETIQSGGRPKGGASEDSGEIPSLGGENIRQSGGLELASVRCVPIAFFNRLTKGVLQSNDVLINKDGANTGKVGFYEGQFERAAINEHVFLLRGKPAELHQIFLYYLLLSQFGQETIKAKISGSAQPGLKSDFIRNFPVRVPKKTPEQSQIGDVLIAVDRAIEQTETLIAKYQCIKTGLMQNLLTCGIDEHGQLRDPTTHKFKPSPLGHIPAEWEVRTLFELADPQTPICYGIVQVKDFVDGGVPTLAIRDLEGDYHTNIHHTAPAIEAQYKRSRIQPNDLLISIKGTTGRIDVVPETFYGNISRDIARIRFRDGAIPYFFKFYFQSQLGTRTLDLVTVGTTRKEISIAPLKEVMVPVPPKEEQELVAGILRIHISMEAAEKVYLGKLVRLKTGLMQDLLTGKVSVEPLLNLKQGGNA